MVPRPGMMTILLILILGRLGQTAVRTAKPDSPYSATRPAPAEYTLQNSPTRPSGPFCSCPVRRVLPCRARPAGQEQHCVVGTTARTKHFESWLRYVRELYLNLVITVNWVPTKEQIADLFTKPRSW